MIADRSLDDEAKYLPLCENCRNHTSSVCTCNTCMIRCKRLINKGPNNIENLPNWRSIII